MANIYIDNEGTEFTEDYLLELAEDQNKDLDSLISNSGLSLKLTDPVKKVADAGSQKKEATNNGDSNLESGSSEPPKKKLSYDMYSLDAKRDDDYNPKAALVEEVVNKTDVVPVIKPVEEITFEEAQENRRKAKEIRSKADAVFDNYLKSNKEAGNIINYKSFFPQEYGGSGTAEQDDAFEKEGRLTYADSLEDLKEQFKDIGFNISDYDVERFFKDKVGEFAQQDNEALQIKNDEILLNAAAISGVDLDNKDKLVAAQRKKQLDNTSYLDKKYLTKKYELQKLEDQYKNDPLNTELAGKVSSLKSDLDTMLETDYSLNRLDLWDSVKASGMFGVTNWLASKFAKQDNIVAKKSKSMFTLDGSVVLNEKQEDDQKTIDSDEVLNAANKLYLEGNTQKFQTQKEFFADRYNNVLADLEKSDLLGAVKIKISTNDKFFKDYLKGQGIDRTITKGPDGFALLASGTYDADGSGRITDTYEVPILTLAKSKKIGFLKDAGFGTDIGRLISSIPGYSFNTVTGSKDARFKTGEDVYNFINNYAQNRSQLIADNTALRTISEFGIDPSTIVQDGMTEVIDTVKDMGNVLVDTWSRVEDIDQYRTTGLENNEVTAQYLENNKESLKQVGVVLPENYTEELKPGMFYQRGVRGVIGFSEDLVEFALTAPIGGGAIKLTQLGVKGVIASAKAAKYTPKLVQWLNSGSKSVTNLKKASNFALTGAVEEMKMKSVFDSNYHAGGGFAFVGIGGLAARYLKFGTGFNLVDQAINIPKAGLVFASSSEVAKFTEGGFDALTGGKTFRRHLEESYSDLDTGSRDFLGNMIFGGMLHVKSAGAKKYNWMSTSKLERLNQEAENIILQNTPKMKALRKKLDRAATPQEIGKAKKELETEQLRLFGEQQKYREIYVVTRQQLAKTRNFEDLISGDVNRVEKYLNKEKQKQTEIYKNLSGNENAEIVILKNSQNNNNHRKGKIKIDGSVAEWNPEDGKVYVDANQIAKQGAFAEPGYIQHELSHELSQQLGEGVMYKTAVKAFKREFPDLYKKIKEKYPELEKEADLENELFSFVVQDLVDPSKRFRYKTRTKDKGLRSVYDRLKKFTTKFSKEKTGVEIEFESDKQVVDYWTDFAIKLKKGKLKPEVEAELLRIKDLKNKPNELELDLAGTDKSVTSAAKPLNEVFKAVEEIYETNPDKKIAGFFIAQQYEDRVRSLLDFDSRFSGYRNNSKWSDVKEDLLADALTGDSKTKAGEAGGIVRMVELYSKEGKGEGVSINAYIQANLKNRIVDYIKRSYPELKEQEAVFEGGGKFDAMESDYTAEDFIIFDEKLAKEEITIPADKPNMNQTLEVMNVLDVPVTDVTGKSQPYKEKTLNTIKKAVNSATELYEVAITSNRTRAPFMDSFRKVMSDELYDSTKQLIKGYKGGLEAFLADARVGFLENTTTTYLSKHPVFRKGVLKSVDGVKRMDKTTGEEVFEPNWVEPTAITKNGKTQYKWLNSEGKVVDGDRVKSDVKGRLGNTSGPLYLKRNPNILNILSENAFIDYFYKDGFERKQKKQNPVDALARQISQDLGVDVFKEAIKDPNSDVRRLFEGKSDLLGVTLAENLVEDIALKAELGGAKAAKSLNEWAKILDVDKETLIPIFNLVLKNIDKDFEGSILDVIAKDPEYADIFKEATLNLTQKLEGSQFEITSTNTKNLINKEIYNELKNKGELKGITFANKDTREKIQKEYFGTSKEFLKSEAIPLEIAKLIQLSKAGNTPGIWLYNTLGYKGNSLAGTTKDFKIKEEIDNTVGKEISKFPEGSELRKAWEKVSEDLKNGDIELARTRSRGFKFNEFKDIAKSKLTLKEKTAAIKKIINSNEYKRKIEAQENLGLAWNLSLNEFVNPKNVELTDAETKKRKRWLWLLKSTTSNNDVSDRIFSPIKSIFIGKSKGTKDYTEHLKMSYKIAGQTFEAIANEAFDKTAYEEIIDGYESSFGPTKKWSVTDKLYGATSNAGLLRFLADPELARNTIDLTTGETMEQKIKRVYSKKDIDLAKGIRNYKEALQQEVIGRNIEGDNTVKAAKNLNDFINESIEETAKIDAKELISKSRGIALGKGKKGSWWVPNSHEDFMGLMYPMIGKGKKGEAQKEYIKEKFTKPFAKAEYNITRERLNTGAEFKALKRKINKELGGKKISKELRKEAWNGYTNEQALRVWIWSNQGMDIPDINTAEIKELKDRVNQNPALVKYGMGISQMLLGKGYPEPQKYWETSNISYDIQQNIEKQRRQLHLKEWQANVDQAFSKDNMNKLEAAYGPSYRKALDKMLSSMKSGQNTTVTGTKIEKQLVNYLNGSVAAIMALNTKSALLQQLSNINFINWTDNNPLKAAKAFANQPQYWKDVVGIINSPYLRNRRSGLRINVTESELAEAANSPNKVTAMIGLLGQKGFLLTQYGDSFAIATGGATFYRNRLNALKKEKVDGELKYTEKQAEEQAMLDFMEISEENQQSSRTDKVGAQQGSTAGKLILAFANTPSQYARLTKKAALDLANGRGSKRENISKIMYYGFVQNLYFSFLQSGLFSVLFDDDDAQEVDGKESDDAKRAMKLANSGLDSTLRGAGGIYGAVFSMIKNTAIKVYEQNKKKRTDYAGISEEVMSISPPIDSKLSKLRQSGAAFDYNKWEIQNRGFSLDNPAVMSAARGVTAVTNVPLDRLIVKTKNMQNAFNSDLENWQRIASALGWQGYELGIEDPLKEQEAAQKKADSKQKAKETREKKKRAKEEAESRMTFEEKYEIKRQKALAKRKKKYGY